MKPRKVFISYAREDQKFALRLARDLRGKGLQVWMDTGIPGGVDWSRAIEGELRQSTEVVVILSPDATASEFVLNEVIFAKNLALPIRPVLHRACDPLLPIASTQYIDLRAESYDEGLQELMNRPSTARTTWHRFRVLLKKTYRPVLAAAVGLAAILWFLSPSETSISVSGGDKSAITARVRNDGGRASTLLGNSFRLHFGDLPIETEALVLLEPAKHSRIAGHDDHVILLIAQNMLTPKLKTEDSYFTRKDIEPLLARAKVSLTAQVRESDGRVKPRAVELPAKEIATFVLGELPDDVP
jgi:TIR domain